MNNCLTAIVIGATCLKWHYKRKKNENDIPEFWKGFYLIQLDQNRNYAQRNGQKIKKSNYPILLAGTKFNAF